MKIKDLFDSPDKWIQGLICSDINNKCLDKDNKRISALSPDAAKWCLVGATVKCYDNGCNDIIKIIQNAIKPEFSYVTTWNDTPGRKFEDVVELVNKLDI